MTIEQKAKCYDDALKMAKKLYEQGTITESLAYIFPELAESEDEKIRKELIEHCRNTRCVTEEGAERMTKYIAWLEKQGEQKPAWSEEDEHRIKDTVYFLDTAKKHYASTVELDACINWLKSLKNRVLPQPKQEWDEEDKRMFDYALDMIEWYGGKNEKRVRLVSDWLKSLKERIGG